MNDGVSAKQSASPRADDLVEIRIHGRGGQGNVIAAYLLAAAAVQDGKHAQAFPAFGAERRGAPVTAYVRCRSTPIRRRSEVEHPDLLIVQDPTLLAIPATLAGLRPGGGIIVNAGRRDSVPVAGPKDSRVVCLPATAIAEKTIGRPIPNVPLLAALVALTGIVPPDALYAALADRFEQDTAARNRQAAEAAAAAVTAGAWRDIISAGEPHAVGD